MAHPVRPLLDAVTGMVRHDYVELFGQRVVERQAVERADVVMQHQYRTPASAALQPQLDAAQLKVLFAPPRHALTSFMNTVHVRSPLRRAAIADPASQGCGS